MAPIQEMGEADEAVSEAAGDVEEHYPMQHQELVECEDVVLITPPQSPTLAAAANSHVADASVAETAALSQLVASSPSSQMIVLEQAASPLSVVDAPSAQTASPAVTAIAQPQLVASSSSSPQMIVTEQIASTSAPVALSADPTVMLFGSPEPASTRSSIGGADGHVNTTVGSPQQHSVVAPEDSTSPMRLATVMHAELSGRSPSAQPPAIVPSSTTVNVPRSISTKFSAARVSTRRGVSVSPGASAKARRDKIRAKDKHRHQPTSNLIEGIVVGAASGVATTSVDIVGWAAKVICRGSIVGGVYVGKKSMSCLYSAGSMGIMKMHQLWRARRQKAVNQTTTTKKTSQPRLSA
jgi:hypothetical protein